MPRAMPPSLTLLYGCGLRISEALDLTPADFRRGAATLRITGKGNKTRLVPLLSVVFEAVEKYRSLCPYHLEGERAALSRRPRRQAAGGDHSAHHAEDAQRLRPAGDGDAACPAPLLRDPPAGRRRRSAEPSRNCSATPASRPPRSTPVWIPHGCSKFMTVPIRGRNLLLTASLKGICARQA